MKPKLDKIIYVIYDDTIAKEKIGYIGKDSFIIEDFNDCRAFDSLEYYYEDYNKTWFSSLNKAKTTLLNNIKKDNPNKKPKIIQINPEYWEIKE